MPVTSRKRGIADRDSGVEHGKAKNKAKKINASQSVSSAKPKQISKQIMLIMRVIVTSCPHSLLGDVKVATKNSMTNT